MGNHQTREKLIMKSVIPRIQLLIEKCHSFLILHIFPINSFGMY